MARKKVEKNISYDDVRKKYYVNMGFGVDDDGKQIKSTKTFLRLSDARKALREHQANKVKGTLVKPQKTTLAEWLEYWMKDVIVPNREETTSYGYQNMIDNHIGPALGKTPVQELKPQQIQKYYTALKAKKLSPATIRKHHDLLKSALRVAVRQEVLVRNPLDMVDPPKPKQKEMAVYTPEDLKKLYDLVEGDRLEIVVKLAGYLGLRREEICGLRWEHIDFDRNLVTIKDARTMAGGKVVEKDTKNRSSTRTLFMAEDLVALLKAEKEKQTEDKKFFKKDYHNTGLVVVWPNGKPYRPNYISELFTKFIKDNGLPKIVLHGLRHTFATVANSMGISLFDIGKAMGHSTPMVTGKIYTHLLDRTHEDTMKKVAERIKK